MNKKENHSAKSEIEQALLRLMTQKSIWISFLQMNCARNEVARFLFEISHHSEVLNSIIGATAEKLNIEFLPMLDTTDERKIQEYLFSIISTRYH